VSNAHPGQRLVGVGANKAHWVLDADLGAGDCVRKAGSYIDVDPAAGRGQYSLTAYMKMTGSTDVWHQRWQVLDGTNNVVATFGGEGFADAADLKSDHVPKTSTGLVVFPPNAFSSTQAALISWQGAC